MAKRLRVIKPASSLPRVIPAAVVALLLSPHSQAQWRFAPTVTATETYTDNVALQPREFAEGQFVTDIAPGFSLINNSRRLKVAAAYQLHTFLYAGSRQPGTRSSQSELQATTQAELVRDMLYLDGSASHGAQSISAFGAQQNGSLYATGNQANVTSWRLSPYLRHRFGITADMTMRYTRDSVDTGYAGFGTSRGQSAAFSLVSGPSFRTVGWGLNLNREELDNELAGNTVSQMALATLSYRLGQSIALIATTGYDKYDYDALGGSTQGKSWTGGFRWTPSSRTDVQASFGRRYFGKTGALAATHRSRRTVWSVNYSDQITTSRAEFLLPSTIDTAGLLDNLFSATITDPIERQQAVSAYILNTGLPTSVTNSVNYFSNRFIRQKQLQATAILNGAHSSAVLSVFDNRRNALSTQQTDSALLGASLATLNDDVRQDGVSGLFVYRLTPRSDALVSLTDTRTRSLATGVTDTNVALRLGLNRRFGNKLRGAVELRHQRGHSDAVNNRGYRENAISATLSTQL